MLSHRRPFFNLTRHKPSALYIIDQILEVLVAALGKLLEFVHVLLEPLSVPSSGREHKAPL